MNSTTAPTGLTGTRRLERPADGRMVAGVAAGIARHLSIDPLLVRLGFVVGALASGVGLLAYLAAWLVVPEEGAERPVLSRSRGSRLTTYAGAVLLACGALLALDALVGGSITGEVFWPAVLLGAGALLLARGDGDTAPVTTAASPDGAPAPRRSRRGTRVVAGTMLLLAGAVTAVAAAGVDVGWQETAGIAVIAAGAALVAGSFAGASPWLAVPPLLLAGAAASVAAAGTTFDGPVGERDFRPAMVADIPTEYRVAIGAVHVDLRDVRFPPGVTRVETHVGIGEAHVELPADVAVRITGHVGAGEIRLPGGSDDGADVDRTETIAAPGRPVVELDVSAGLGEVRVEREAGR